MTVDLGFWIHREIRLRLQGIDTHETYGVSKDSDEYQQGMIETQFVEDWLHAGETDEYEWPFVTRTAQNEYSNQEA